MKDRTPHLFRDGNARIFGRPQPGSVIAPSVSVSRTTGTAPLAVHFDASATTADSTTLPFHELDYTWSFGDAGAGTWATSGRSKNASRGPIAGHVFETDGTYNWTLTVRDTSGTEQAFGSVTVTAPDSGYTHTYYHTTQGTMPGSPPSEGPTVTHRTSSTWATVQGDIASGNRVLLYGSDTWTGSNGSIGGTVSLFEIGSWGGGKATITAPAGARLFTIQGASDIRFVDLIIRDGSGTSQIGGASGDPNVNVLFLNCEMIDNASPSGGEIDWFQNPTTAGTPGDFHDGCFFANHSSTGRTGVSQCIFGAMQRSAILGCSFTVGITESIHGVRTQLFQQSVVADCIFDGAGTNHHALKLTGFDSSENSTPGTIAYQEQTNHCVVYGSEFRVSDGQGSRPLQIAPIDQDKDANCADMIVDSNYFYKKTVSGSGGRHMMSLQADRITATNNILDLTNHTGGTTIDGAIWALKDSGNITIRNLRIYNNTLIIPNWSTPTAIVFGPTTEDSFARNNLVETPAGTSLTMVDDRGTNNTYSNNSRYADAGFVTDPPTQPSHFALLTGSSAKNAGTTVPVFKDYGGTTVRPKGASYDQGAWEFDE